MSSTSQASILTIDDDPITLRVLNHILTKAGYHVIAAQSGFQALQILSQTKPDLILLDVMMPNLDGYEICSKIQQQESLAYIPVIFVTALTSQQSQEKAFAVGGVDYLGKPFHNEELLDKVKLHLKTNARWEQVHQDFISWDKWSLPDNFANFKQYLIKQANLAPSEQEVVLKLRPAKLYSLTEIAHISSSQLAKYLSDFLKSPYVEEINPEIIKLGVLPPQFCKANLIIPVHSPKSANAFLISNPFNWELLELLNRVVGNNKKTEISITPPENILSLFSSVTRKDQIQLDQRQSANAIKNSSGLPQQANLTTHPKYLGDRTPIEVKQPVESDRSIEELSNNILQAAVTSRASDIHLAPKSTYTTLRFRIDGDMRDIRTLPKDIAAKLITRLKALGGLEITERRRPQDGAFETTINNRYFRLRLATTSTPDGESLIIRLLEPTANPKTLNELGMNAQQNNLLTNMAAQTQGLILVVGPTGSGKSTTIYSLLSQVNTKTRSLISVEDPVEYRIPDANQQQVIEKAGITFESLLKSAMRQDPDILFLGEIRDPYSAKVCIDFASTGHITISSLHSASSTAAIFRLEQLGVTRSTMADALLGIIAQKLLKKLCGYCKRVAPITAAEAEMLAPFTSEIPTAVAHAVGCPKCNNTGYFGREGIYEILHFDATISEMVRRNVPLPVIRSFAKQRGDCLISNHAVAKVKELLFSPGDIYEKVLLEELRFQQAIPQQELAYDRTPVIDVTEQKNLAPVKINSLATHKQLVLVIEPEVQDQKLLENWLQAAGYQVLIAENTVDALFELGKRKFSVIISNVKTPFLDGQKLLEILQEKSIDTPVIFLTTDPAKEIEAKGLDNGAADYIRKPLEKDTLLVRVKTNLNIIDREKTFTQAKFN